jgi:hypothetical protein
MKPNDKSALCKRPQNCFVASVVPKIGSELSMRCIVRLCGPSWHRLGASLFLLALVTTLIRAEGPPGQRTYEHRLTALADPPPLLAGQPEFVEPIRAARRFETPMLIDDDGADLHVRAWRFSYNARGIIEVPNRLRARDTAVIVVHPWGIDDGQGWQTPTPAGVAFACTPEKNRVALEHMRRVVNPFLKSLRGKVGLIAYSLPGAEDPIRKKLYRSVRTRPTEDERRQGAKELAARLKDFTYRGQPLPQKLIVSTDRPVVDYFRQLPGLDAGAKYNGPGFWDLPIPVARPLEVGAEDVVIYDADGYAVLKAFLEKQGIRHVLLAGYHTDMCVCRTTAGYKNLAQDFNTFLVGDATQATFPAADTPRFATTAAVSFASLEVFITQVSWVRLEAAASGVRPAKK